MIIYKAINQVNGKIYIGQTIGTLKKRKAEHIGDAQRKNYHFINALKKYGANNFYWAIINTCYDIDTLNQLEKYYIKYYNSMNREFGYNCTSGGDNYIRTEETRKKMRQAKTSPETRQKMSIAKKGKSRPKDVCEKISKTLTGVKKTAKARKKMSISRKMYFKKKKLGGNNNA